MAVYNKFDSFVAALAHKVHKLDTDQVKIALSNIAPIAGNTVLVNITEIAYTNLSTRLVTTTSSGQTAGAYKLVLQDLILTSTGGTTGPFRYVIVYNDTAINKELIAWFDYGAAVTLNSAESLTVDFNAANGLFGAV